MSIVKINNLHELKSIIKYKLENLVSSHLRIGDPKLAIAIWYRKNNDNGVYFFEGMDSYYMHGDRPQLPFQEIVYDKNAIGWELEYPLYHTIAYSPKATLEKLIKDNSPLVDILREESEVLYFNQEFLSPSILEYLGIITEPNNFLKGWYLTSEETISIIKNKRIPWLSNKPDIGVMQISESSNFENKVGIMHVEIGNKWLPSSKNGVRNYSWYLDSLNGNPGSILFEGKTLFKIEGFEIKKLKNVSKEVVISNANDEYVEVHLSKLSLHK